MCDRRILPVSWKHDTGLDTNTNTKHNTCITYGYVMVYSINNLMGSAFSAFAEQLA